MMPTPTAALFETIMVLSFGMYWPRNVFAALKERTADKETLKFLLTVDLAYFFGMLKNVFLFLDGYRSSLFYLCSFFYVAGFLAVTVAVILYFRNAKIDKERKKKWGL